MNRNKLLAGLAIAAVLIAGLVAWQVERRPAATNIAATNTDAATPTADAGDAEIGPLADASAQPMNLYEDDHVLGSPDAPITMIEYASLTCPHCAAFHNEVLPQIKENYIDKGLVRLVFRDFPLDRIALHGSQIADCANEDSYFRIIGVMFNTQAQWAASADPTVGLEQIGRTGGVAQDAIDACVADEAMIEKILTRAQEAQTLYGINSTPSFVINGQVVKGSDTYEEFDRILSDLLPKS